MEGLAYLTLDADVKDDFVEDEQALQAMFELAKVLSPYTVLSSLLYHQALQSNTASLSRSSSDPKPSPLV